MTNQTHRVAKGRVGIKPIECPYAACKMKRGSEMTMAEHLIDVHAMVPSAAVAEAERVARGARVPR